MSEPRRIKKIVREPVSASLPKEPRDYTPHSKPRAVAGYVTLSEMAVKAGIQAQLARLWMHKAGIKKPADGWRWKQDSRELARVRKVFESVLTQE